MRTFLKGAIVGITVSVGFCANISFAGIPMNAAEPGTVDYFIDNGAQCFTFKKGETARVVCARSPLGFFDAHVFQKLFWVMMPVVRPEHLWIAVDLIPEKNMTFVYLSDDEYAHFAVGSGTDFQEAMEVLKNNFLKLHLKK